MAKGWHRCSRWTRRGFESCPFGKLHELIGEDDLPVPDVELKARAPAVKAPAVIPGRIITTGVPGQAQGLIGLAQAITESSIGEGVVDAVAKEQLPEPFQQGYRDFADIGNRNASSGSAAAARPPVRYSAAPITGHAGGPAGEELQLYGDLGIAEDTVARTIYRELYQGVPITVTPSADPLRGSTGAARLAAAGERTTSAQDDPIAKALATAVTYAGSPRFDYEAASRDIINRQPAENPADAARRTVRDQDRARFRQAQRASRTVPRTTGLGSGTGDTPGRRGNRFFGLIDDQLQNTP